MAPNSGDRTVEPNEGNSPDNRHVHGCFMVRLRSSLGGMRPRCAQTQSSSFETSSRPTQQLRGVCRLAPLWRLKLDETAGHHSRAYAPPCRPHAQCVGHVRPICPINASFRPRNSRPWRPSGCRWDLVGVRRRRSAWGSLDLVLDGSANPARHRAVILARSTPNLLDGLWREPDRYKLTEPRPAPTRRSLRLLVLWLRVKVVLFLAGHLLGGHRSFRYRFARWSAAS